MAVTAIINQFNAAHDGPSAADLGMDYGMGGQVPLASIPDSGATLDRTAAQSLLREMYQPLKRHYEWFRRTQRGQIKQYGRKARSRTEGYRWRGRSEAHVLTSGMDDYPRGLPHAGELHLDLISWMGFFSRTMKDFAKFIGEEEDAESFGEIERAIINNIDGDEFFLFHPSSMC
jgi:mannosyl-oligosaccharide glucosidase